jgi:aminoglycoside phosphotransferase
MPVATDPLAELRTIDVPVATARELGIPAAALTLRRAWPRSGGALTLEYVGPAGVLAAQASRDLVRLERAARRLPGAAVVMAGDRAVLLQPGGIDRVLASVPSAVRSPGASLVAHRAERRATVALGGAFLKIVRPGDISQLAERHRAVHALPAPAVLAADGATGTLVLSVVAGISLHELLRTGRAGTAQLAAVGRAVRDLHRQPSPPAGILAGPHQPAQEATVLRGWLAKLADPDWAPLHARLAPAIDDVAAALDRLSPATPATIHRDLHDKQLMVDDGGRVGVIDLDTLSLGDPAIDLANLLAHLRLRALQDPAHAAALDSWRAALVEGYAPPYGWRERVHLLEQATLLRLACVYAFRPTPRHPFGALSEALLAESQAGTSLLAECS